MLLCFFQFENYHFFCKLLLLFYLASLQKVKFNSHFSFPTSLVLLFQEAVHYEHTCCLDELATYVYYFFVYDDYDEQRNPKKNFFPWLRKKEKQKRRFGKKVQMVPTLNVCFPL